MTNDDDQCSLTPSYSQMASREEGRGHLVKGAPKHAPRCGSSSASSGLTSDANETSAGVYNGTVMTLRCQECSSQRCAPIKWQMGPILNRIRRTRMTWHLLRIWIRI
jgi:hypothetical protein